MSPTDQDHPHTGAVGELLTKQVIAPVQRNRHPWYRWHAPHDHCPHGRTRPQLDALLRAIACEARRRTVRAADTEEQWWDAKYLHQAQAQLN